MPNAIQIASLFLDIFCEKVMSQIFGTFFDRFQITIMYSLTFSDSTSSNPRRKSERIKRIVEVNYQEQTEKMISGKTAFCLHFLQFQIFAGHPWLVKLSTSNPYSPKEIFWQRLKST